MRASFRVGALEMADFGRKSVLCRRGSLCRLMIYLGIFDPNTVNLVINEFARSDGPFGSIFSVRKYMLVLEIFILFGAPQMVP